MISRTDSLVAKRMRGGHLPVKLSPAKSSRVKPSQAGSRKKRLFIFYGFTRIARINAKGFADGSAEPRTTGGRESMGIRTVLPTNEQHK
jgi:hypothetical protein